MTIDHAGPVPIHHQLATMLRAEIDAGAYPPGVRLPTELELCERHGVSRTPARRALSTLAAEGLIVRYRRRGSFVVEGHVPGTGVDVARFGPSAGDPEWSDLVGSIGAGRAPDAAVVPVGWLSELMAMGAVGPIALEPHPLEALWVPDALRATWQRPGGSYAVPVSVDLHCLVVRRDALGALGGRPPAVWSDLRSLLVAARDLTPGVRSPFVMAAGAAGGVDTVIGTWLLLAAAGGGFGGSGPLDVERSGTEVFRFLRRLIDTGLMSPDVVRLDAQGVLHELRTGRAVAGIAPFSLSGDADMLFTGFPGSGTTGPETSTLATGLVGVVMAQSRRGAAAGQALDALRSAQVSTFDPGLLASGHGPPVTPHYRVLSTATGELVEGVISGSATVDAAMRAFGAVADLLGG